MNPGMTPSEYQALQESAKLLTTPVPPPPATPTPVVSSPPVHAALSLLEELALKDVGVLSKAALIQRYGPECAAKVIELAKSQALTAQQATVKYQRAMRLAAQEYGKDLRAAGVKPMQHSVQDFVHVIYTQLELQLNGENPSANEVLNLAFPDDPTKAKRIGDSKRMQRVQEAYDSPEVMNHTVEKAMLEHHGQRRMNLRTQTPQFSHSLAAGVVLFEGYTQGAEIVQLKQEVQLLKQQVECTKNREALDDAGATSSKEKVLALHNEGKKPTEITRLLGMKVDTVKSILRRSKNS